MSEHAVVDRLTCVLCPVGCELEVGDSRGRWRPSHWKSMR